jgi:type IV pilus assembly protein PilY1
VALASPLPRIEIPLGGQRVTLVPFAKSVAGASINAARGAFQPTNQIVDFYVESMAADGTSGTFLVNFEDVEAGNDHDMDAIARYSYAVVGGQVQVTVERLYEQGSITHHMGYVISGTTADGIYLVVQDDNTNVRYFLDTPPGRLPGACTFTLCADRGTFPPGGGALPWINTRAFSPGTGEAAELLRDPLWYAAKWGGFRDLNDNDIPDLQEEWDAKGDGNPDNYFLVTNALTLGEQLTKAFNEIIDRVTTASSASVNSGSISSETRLYQAKFSTRDWTGQLLSFRIDTDTGQLSTVDWDAAEEIPAANAREIVTRNSNGAGAAFRWDALDATRKAQLELLDGLGEERLDYLRGDTSREQRNAGGVFRNRPTLTSGEPALLGDIVSSSPVFVGRPPFRYRDDLEAAPYSAFRIAQDDRRPMVYAGANDGMLHAFDGETGQERFAFVPGSIFGRLPALTDPNYNHLFFVDGPPNMGDVFFKGPGEWRTVLVGGLNKGGQAVYALDVTDPDTLNESNASNVVLWEFSDADDADLGFTFSQPAIIRTRDNGRWVAVFGNGYNNTAADGSASATGNAALYFVDIETGALVRKINTQTGIASPGSGGRPNGLATPAAVDTNGDGTADYVYAGDLYGNLWKFDIRSTDPANWRVAYGTTAAPLPLFTATDAAGNRQPITSRPEVGRGPAGVGTVVLFGTGKFLEPSDKVVETTLADFRVQSLYGIFDRNSGTAATDRVTSRTSLVQQKILAEELYTTPSDSFLVRVTSRETVTTGNRGWFMDLAFDANADGSYGSGEYKGEKLVANPVLRAGRAIFTTLVPDPDPCGFGGGGWLMEFDSLTGARLAASPFDLNNDRLFNDLDFIEIEVNGDKIRLPVSGVASKEGIIQSPGILADPNRPLEFKYSPGTTGNIQVTVENPGPSGFGRQSWRQIR